MKILHSVKNLKKKTKFYLRFTYLPKRIMTTKEQTNMIVSLFSDFGSSLSSSSSVVDEWWMESEEESRSP